MSISSKLLLENNFNTVRNHITFSIVYTNNNGMDRFNPPPQSKIRKMNAPSKLSLNVFFKNVTFISLHEKSR